MLETKTNDLTRLEITNVDRDLKNRFKAACRLNDKDMKDVLIDFMTEYVIVNRIPDVEGKAKVKITPSKK